MKKIFKNPLIIFLLFLVIGLGIYANSFDNELFWDDHDSIVNNAYIKDWKFLPNFFTENLIAGAGQISNYYRPILLISFALDYHIWGLEPLGFHFTNTIIHIFSAWLVYLILMLIMSSLKNDKIASKYSLWLSFIPALMFLVHPLQTEAVSYVAGRADPLSTLFSLLAIWFYLSFRRNKQNKKANYGFCLLFFILGILTKEQVILLPLLMMLVDWALENFSLKKDKIAAILKRTVPLFFLSAVYLVLHFTILNFKGEGDFSYHNEIYNQNILIRIFTFFKVMLSYFKLLFVPAGLHMAREVAPVLSFLSWPVLGFLLLFSLLVLICVKTWRKSKLPCLGFLWFFIILSPRMNILPVNRPMYEHWLYLPMVGFWLAVISLVFLLIGMMKNGRLKKVVIGFLALLFAICSLQFVYLTISRNNDWQDPITFYEKNLQYTPNSFIQHNNLGMAYAEQRRFEESIAEYNKAIAIKDIYPQVHHNLANSLAALGKFDEAIEEYERALEISPLFEPSYGPLAELYGLAEEKEKIQGLYDKYYKNFNKNKK
ncbi:tetratricopeptide repeat protein [Candidatus Falkowbacteria bacterium]|nr:tetratricopeptide repeat protein [Candidatus Falkowbacteria bacterium]